MGFLSGLTKGLGDAWDSITNDFADNFSGIEHWLTGSSQSNRQYRYQTALNDTQMGFEASEARKAFERESAFAAEQSALAAQRQYDYTRQYFDYTAAYNTPAMQMERLREAGLNPNLVYGNGAMAMQSGVSSIGGQEASAHASSPRGSAGSATGGQGGDIGAALSGIVGAARGIVDLQRSMADTKLINAKAKAQDLANERWSFVQRPVVDGYSQAGNAIKDMRKYAGGAFDYVRDFVRDKWADFQSRARNNAQEMKDSVRHGWQSMRDWFDAHFAGPPKLSPDDERRQREMEQIWFKSPIKPGVVPKEHGDGIIYIDGKPYIYRDHKK